ncbi:bifunctional diguanylate cyclase/phosphodiesterase [Allohahella marinimesophila]|uniref:Diguanylate cyclase (GGDEF)-like protein n=1 Tax=Allohahella marinimesophila TaxID=1054972 RepID=A0ABP7P8Z1_9GAMM
MKLNAKILLIILPLLVVAIGCTGWFAHSQLSEASLDNSRRQVDAALLDLRSSILATQSNTHSNLDLFAADTLLQRYVLTDEESRYDLLLTALLRLLSSYQKAYPAYFEIRILMPNGFEDVRLSSLDIINTTEYEANSPIFERILAAGELDSSFFEMNPDTDQVAFYFTKPLLVRDNTREAFDAKPTLRAYLSVAVSLQWLQDKMDEASTETGAVLMLTDASGKVFTHSGNTDFIHATEQLHSKLPAAHPSRTMLETLLAGVPVQDFSTINLNGQDGYLWSRPVAESYRLAAWLPARELIKRSSELALFIMLICLASVFVISFVLYVQLNMLIIRPIRHLQRATEAIGRGHLLKKIHIKGNDEVGALAESINAMSSSLQKSHEQVRFLAYHDTLTALPNRLMFYEHLSGAIATAKRTGARFAVLYLDLDHFKRVNDTLGHRAGDQLLSIVAERLAHCMRESDFIARSDGEENHDSSPGILARIGGDEFLLLLQDIPDLLLPGIIAERIVDSISQPIPVDNNECYVSASLGITIYPDDGQSPDLLIKYADIAMYHAKGEGRNNFQYYRDSMNSAMVERANMESKLREAIRDNRLFLLYQPQADLRTGEVIGVEALVRWKDPELGMISPSTFIPFAEENGLIVEIGTWVLEQACKQAVAWLDETDYPIKVAVNVSAVQFAKGNFQEVVRNTLARTGLDPAHLCLEITETSFMEHIDRIDVVLEEIRELGVLIALDDFGKGFSSLNYLRQFPIDILKIDRGFVNELSTTSDTGAIITAIIAMAHALGIKVIAEGVENTQQLECLRERNCDFVQGFYLHVPQDGRKIPPLLVIE